MKKIFTVFAILAICLIVIPSCGRIDDLPQDDTSVSINLWNPDEKTLESMFDGNVPSIERYAFLTLGDFKVFSETASRNVDDYSTPPLNNAFPPYNMAKGCFVDLSELFPKLDMKKITINHIEIENSYSYSYYGFVNDTQTPFSISFRYKKDAGNVTVEEVIQEVEGSAYNQIIGSDYYGIDEDSYSKNSSALYVFKTNSCIIQYDVYKTKVQGMVIRSGDLIIGISPAYSDNTAFFTDKTLSPISCLFQDSVERSSALENIAVFAKSNNKVFP